MSKIRQIILWKIEAFKAKEINLKVLDLTL